jgi:hypothetical protein
MAGPKAGVINFSMAEHEPTTNNIGDRMTASTSHEVTQLLIAWSKGDEEPSPKRRNTHSDLAALIPGFSVLMAPVSDLLMIA